MTNGIIINVELYTEKTGAKSKRDSIARQVSRYAQMANKRMQRLEDNNLQMVGAFKEWERQGKPHYSVKGKDYNELQSEFWKIKKVLDDTTSTVRGANYYLRNIASQMGFKNMSLSQIKENVVGYWKVFSRVKQYLSTVENEGYNIGSPRIQEMITNYVTTSKRDLNNVEDLNNALSSIIQEVGEYAQMPEEMLAGAKVWYEVW